MNYRYLVEDEDAAPPGEWRRCFGRQFVGQPEAYTWFNGLLPGLTGTRDPGQQRQELVTALEIVKPMLPPLPDVLGNLRQRLADQDARRAERLESLRSSLMQSPTALPTPARPAWIKPDRLPSEPGNMGAFWKRNVPRKKPRARAIVSA
jgi:hypothetical protein